MAELERKIKVAIITCYRDPDYIRARTLRTGFASFPNIETHVLKNTATGIMRYAQVLWGVIKLRFTVRPDAYVLTFRGYELVSFLQVLAWPKPIVFDEFINLYEWTVQEHHKLKAGGVLARTLNIWWGFVLRRCKIILADTPAHAEYSARISRVPRAKYMPVPVGADETLFRPGAARKESGKFRVFYYGNMLPLHGLEYALAAAEQLKDEPNIEFLFVGGKELARQQVERARKNGANVTYKKWIPFEDLPQVIRDSDLCLGGPFGNTVQSQFVVTGKTYQFLACGSPTIIGASTAASEFHDGKDCLIVPQGDATALSQKILWAYKHPKDLSNIAQHGCALYERQFSALAIARALAPVVRQFS